MSRLSTVACRCRRGRACLRAGAHTSPWCTQMGPIEVATRAGGPPSAGPSVGAPIPWPGLPRRLPAGRDALRAARTRIGWTTHRSSGSDLPHTNRHRRRRTPLPRKARNTPWHPDASASRSSATACPPSFPTSTRTRPESGSSRSTPWSGPAAGAGPGTSCSGCWNAPVSSRLACPACAAPTTSTPSRPSASHGSLAMSTSSGGSGPTSAGTPPSWCPAPTGPGWASAATSPPTPRRPACTRSASTTSSAARTTASPATRSSSRATRLPASMPGPSSRAV